MTFVASISHDKYWTEFDVLSEDLDFIYNLLLEREVPLTTREMALALVGDRIERLQREAEEADRDKIEVYRPAQSYEEGQMLTFPALGNVTGKIIAVRSGENPSMGTFDVIRIDYGDSDEIREFAANLEEHILNRPAEQPGDGMDDNSPENILQRYGDAIEERLIYKLNAVEDIVRIAGRWFPKTLLADINVGHLNLTEAVLDVAGGGPLPTSDLMEHIELPENLRPLLAEFSLDYALQEDDRFDEVGPAGQVLWFLRRLEPPEVLYPPPRLEYRPVDHDRSLLPDFLLDLEEKLDDELSPLGRSEEAKDEVIVPLLFPHWRVGSLPLSRRLQPLFPTAYEAPRIRFILVDGHSSEKFPGWVVREQRYVYGLDEWFRRCELPAGGLVKVRRGEKPGEVIVEAMDRRSRNDWIRTVSIGSDRQIGFTMLKQPVGTAYEDLMVVGLIDPVALDEAWLRGDQRKMPVDRLVAQVFRELAKLNPQTAVHAQTLYACVNVIRRMPPAPIFAELVSRPYYLHVGDLYWRFDDSGWSDS